MYAQDNLNWEQFEQKFREAFGRDMRHDEHEWFYSIWKGVQANEEEKTKGAAA